MAQHDYVIANGTGAAVRSDLNNALAAIVSQNSGATEPATTYAYQWWADTNTGLLKIRNGANNGWITLRELDGTLTIEAGTVSAPGLAFASDLNTGVWSPGADQFAIATNGVERVEWGTSEVVFNDGGANYDFRIEGDTNANLFFVDASAEAVGIGTTSPSQKMHLEDSGSNVYLRVTETGNTGIDFGQATDGNGVINLRDSAAIQILTGGTERARIDSSGRLLVGTSSNRGNWFNNSSWGGPLIQLESTSSTESAYSVTNSANNANAPLILLGKNRSGTIGGNTVVQSGDSCGQISFFGNDGTQMVEAARIDVAVDATPGADDMPGRLVFSVTRDGQASPTEALRINANGTVGTFVANVSGASALWAAHSASAGTSEYLFYGTHSATGTYSGTNTFQVFTNGNVRNTNNSYTAISDIKLKENVVDAGSQWDDLKALRVRNYNLKEGQTHRQIGLIAQEVEPISPGLVYESPDRDAEGNDLGTVTKSVNYSVLYMKAVKALQEAMERIETLEAKVAALESA